MLQNLLGIGTPAGDLSIIQAVMRAVLVYGLSLAIVRIGRNRLLGRSTSLDIILGIMLGSILSRGINGAAPMSTSLVAGLVLVLLHRLLAQLTFHLPWLSYLINGQSVSLIENGSVDWIQLKSRSISPRDLEEEIRLNGNVSKPEDVKLARLERNGEISVVRRGTPKIIDMKIEDGVKTVRLELI